MRILTWMKRLTIGLLLICLTGYGIFQSDWFQKKYLYPYPYRDLVHWYALEHELDPQLVAAVIRTESKFVSLARSPKGARGLMQLMPETAQWIAEQRGAEDFELSQLDDPEINIKFGTWYLASLYKEFHGNEALALAAYNGGRGNVNQWMKRYGWSLAFQDIDQIPFKETRQYVGRVLHSKERYRTLYGVK